MNCQKRQTNKIEKSSYVAENLYLASGKLY